MDELQHNGIRHEAPGEALELSYSETWMSSVYPDYFSNSLCYPNEWSRDMSHFGGEYAMPEGLNKIIREAYEDTELLRSQRLEPENEK